MKMTRRSLITGVLAALVAGGGAAWWRRLASGYAGPVSDHFDGTRFVGRYAAPDKSAFDFWYWRWTRKPAQWPEHLPNPPAEKPPAQVVDGIRVTFAGHASLLVQAGGHNILIDPVWSERASPVTFAGPKRHRDPGIAFGDLPKIDTVLVTHGHYDHLDVVTLSRLAARDNPRVITLLGNDLAMKNYDAAIRAEAFDWHQRVVVSERLAVAPIPTKHWSARSLLDRNKSLWGGFVIETAAGKILHLGDSGYDDTLFKELRERYGPFALAHIPIGAYEPRWFMQAQHLNPAEAVQTLIDSGAQRALGYHFGTFQLTDESIEAPVIALREALVAANVPAERFIAPEPGQSLTV